MLNETMTSLCIQLRNFHLPSPPVNESGSYRVVGGKIALKGDYRIGQWLTITPVLGCFKIADRDGDTYTLDNADGIDLELDNATVYSMQVPLSFLRLCEDVDKWMKNNAPSNLVSENVIGEYSYTKAIGHSGLPAGVYEVFAKELAPWRRYMTGVRL